MSYLNDTRGQAESVIRELLSNGTLPDLEDLVRLIRALRVMVDDKNVQGQAGDILIRATCLNPRIIEMLDKRLPHRRRGLVHFAEVPFKANCGADVRRFRYWVPRRRTS